MMKENIRRCCFETNSSSVHTLILCSDDEFSKWKNGELYLDIKNKILVESNKQIELARSFESEEECYDKMGQWDYWHRYLTWDEYYSWDYITYEKFNTVYLTPKKEIVHAFGYYGND